MSCISVECADKQDGAEIEVDDCVWLMLLSWSNHTMVCRTLSNLQLLANEMTPFLQHNQQHILEQAARANAAAPQSATTPFADAGSEDYVNASSSLECKCPVLLLSAVALRMDCCAFGICVHNRAKS